MNGLTYESQHILMRTEMRVSPESDLEQLAAELTSMHHTGDLVAHFHDGRVQSITVIKENRVFAKITLDTPRKVPVG